jgi:hypothetical protein
MPEQDAPSIDETKIPAQMLFRILPEDAINELAKSLLSDIFNAPPPFFTQAGEDLYTHGNVNIGLGNDGYESANITTSIEIGKDAVDSVISHMISNSDKEIEIESLGDKDEVINKVGLFILSNVNDMSDLHEFACGLFSEIGALAYYRGDGDIDAGGISSYINETINTKLEKVASIKEKFYWQGVKKHINEVLKSEKITVVKRVIEIFNDVIGGDDGISVEDSVDISYEQHVIDDVIEYLLNPIKFLRDNSDLIINLTAYENEHGKLPRQPELPGLE